MWFWQIFNRSTSANKIWNVYVFLLVGLDCVGIFQDFTDFVLRTVSFSWQNNFWENTHSIRPKFFVMLKQSTILYLELKNAPRVFIERCNYTVIWNHDDLKHVCGRSVWAIAVSCCAEWTTANNSFFKTRVQVEGWEDNYRSDINHHHAIQL